MTGLVPFNHSSNSLAHAGAGFEDFYNMLDDFFNDSLMPRRSLLRDSFKIDIEEVDKEYRIEAELPGIHKDEVDLSIDGDSLCISVNREEEANHDGRNYIHRERRVSSMNRRIRLSEANLAEIKAKLEDGVLTVTVPKDTQAALPRKIDIE